MLMQLVYNLTDRLSPEQPIDRNPLLSRGHHGFVKDRQVETLRLAFTWAVLTILAALVYVFVGGGYDVITGHQSFLIDRTVGAPVIYCIAGAALQGLRSGAAGILARLPVTASESYVPPPLVRWLLTPHDSDLLVQLVVTVAAAGFFWTVSPGPHEHVPF
jgi:hypothetical protein